LAVSLLRFAGPPGVPVNITLVVVRQSQFTPESFRSLQDFGSLWFEQGHRLIESFGGFFRLPELVVNVYHTSIGLRRLQAQLGIRTVFAGEFLIKAQSFEQKFFF